MDVIQCPICYGESAEYLGELTGLPYYRCTHCGIQWQHEPNNDDLLAKLEKKQCND